MPALVVRSGVQADDNTDDVEPMRRREASQDAGALVLEERFAIVPEWVLDAPISDAAVRLYAVLLRYGQSSGQRMPSRRTLAGRLRKSVDSVDRALKELVAVGAVEVTRRSRDGLNLTNRYLVRATRRDAPVPMPAEGAAGGGRTAAATPDDALPSGACRARGSHSGRGWGGRTGAARGSRRAAAGVAAPVRPDPEFFTENNPPPHPSSVGRRDLAAEVGRHPRPLSEGPGSAGAARGSRVLGMLGLDTEGLLELAGRCAQLRHEQGLPSGLWTKGRLVEVLADAVLDHGLPADLAVAALLAVAADPVTRSPARLSCPGPWWEPGRSPAEPTAAPDTDVTRLEAVLAEADGLRVIVQRQARAQLAAEGLPVTRRTVTRRAVDLLEAVQHSGTAAGKAVGSRSTGDAEVG